MNYETETCTGTLKEILGEEERYFPQSQPKKITFTKIRIRLNNGNDYETRVLNKIPECYKNKQITLEEISKVKNDGTQIFKEILSSEKLATLIFAVRLKENRI